MPFLFSCATRLPLTACDNALHFVDCLVQLFWYNNCSKQYRMSLQLRGGHFYFNPVGRSYLRYLLDACLELYR